MKNDVYAWQEFDEWARHSTPMSLDAEQIVGVTNEKLAGCRPTEAVLDDFLRFLDLPDTPAISISST